MEIHNKVKIGLFGIGLDTYWNQFDGLLDNLNKYQAQIKTKIESFGAEVFDAGMIDNPEKANEADVLLKPLMWNWYFCLFQHMHFHQQFYQWPGN